MNNPDQNITGSVDLPNHFIEQTEPKPAQQTQGEGTTGNIDAHLVSELPAAPGSIHEGLRATWGSQYDENMRLSQQGADLIFEGADHLLAQLPDELFGDADIQSAFLLVGSGAQSFEPPISEERLREIWGQSFDQEHKAATSALVFLFGDRQDLLAQLEELGAMNHPVTWRALAKFGKHLSGKINL